VPDQYSTRAGSDLLGPTPDLRQVRRKDKETVRGSWVSLDTSVLAGEQRQRAVEPPRVLQLIWRGAAEPVIAGRLDLNNEIISFTYGQSYLARDSAIPIYLPELPLRRGPIEPVAGEIAGCISDGAPDSWGRLVILKGIVGAGALDTADLGILTYLLESASDRTGALDFQTSATTTPRGTQRRPRSRN
jgi:hypothetical protein